MRVSKKNRARLVSGEIVELTFRERPALRTDQTYSLQTEKGTRVGTFRVVKIRRIEDKWIVPIRLEGDEVRLLAKGGGYTDFAGRAMDAVEAEAVRENCGRLMRGGGDCCQYHMAIKGRTSTFEHRRNALEEARGHVGRVMESVRDGMDPQDRKNVERWLKAVDRKIRNETTRMEAA